MKNLKKVTVVGALTALAMSLSGVAIATLASGEERPSNLRFVADDNGGDRAKSSSDDPAGHDAGDDHGGDGDGGSDDSPGHDAGDDNGGDDDNDDKDDDD